MKIDCMLIVSKPNTETMGYGGKVNDTKGSKAKEKDEGRRRSETEPRKTTQR